MHDDHGHDAHSSHGHDDAHAGHDHGHGGAVEPLEFNWSGIAMVVLAVALIAMVGWWASNNKPVAAATAAPIGAVIHSTVPSQLG